MSMLVQVDQKGQITIPADVMSKLKIKEGDYLSIGVDDGNLMLCPMLVCPKTDMTKIAEMVKELEKISKDPDSYYGISKMFADMGV